MKNRDEKTKGEEQRREKEVKNISIRENEETKYGFMAEGNEIHKGGRKG